MCTQVHILCTQAFSPQCLSLAVLNMGEGLVKLSHVNDVPVKTCVVGDSIHVIFHSHQQQLIIGNQTFQLLVPLMRAAAW